MDFVKEKEVIIEEVMTPANITLKDYEYYTTVRINGYSVFNIYQDGTFSRVGSIHPKIGLQIDDDGKIKERV